MIDPIGGHQPEPPSWRREVSDGNEVETVSPAIRGADRAGYGRRAIHVVAAGRRGNRDPLGFKGSPQIDHG